MDEQTYKNMQYTLNIEVSHFSFGTNFHV